MECRRGTLTCCRSGLVAACTELWLTRAAAQRKCPCAFAVDLAAHGPLAGPGPQPFHKLQARVARGIGRIVQAESYIIFKVPVSVALLALPTHRQRIPCSLFEWSTLDRWARQWADRASPLPHGAEGAGVLVASAGAGVRTPRVRTGAHTRNSGSGSSRLQGALAPWICQQPHAHNQVHDAVVPAKGPV